MKMQYFAQPHHFWQRTDFLKARLCLAELCNCKMPIKGKNISHFWVFVCTTILHGKGNRHSMLEGLNRRGKWVPFVLLPSEEIYATDRDCIDIRIMMIHLTLQGTLHPGCEDCCRDWSSREINCLFQKWPDNFLLIWKFVMNNCIYICILIRVDKYFPWGNLGAGHEMPWYKGRTHTFRSSILTLVLPNA